jgi:hypothetical protein
MRRREVEIELYWEEKKLYREVRMTIIWEQILNARMAIKSEWREYLLVPTDSIPCK